MSEHVINTVNRLIQIELGSIRAYEEAIEGANSLEIRSKLTTFMSDHHRHVRDLSAHVSALGGKPAERRDLLGVLMEAFSAVLSMNDRTALVSVRATEELMDRYYCSALGEKLPEDASNVIQKIRDNHEQHLDWIKQALQQLDS